MLGSPAFWDSGKIGTCAAFTGNVNNVIYNNTSTLNYTDNFSWCLWIKPNYTDGSGAQFVFTIGRADAGGRGYGLRVNATNGFIYFGSSVYTIPLQNNEWTHVAFTKNGINVCMYINGALYSETTFTGTLPTYVDGKGLGIGCFHYSANIYPFSGSINDFRIYSHTLSPKEISLLSQGLVCHIPMGNIDGKIGGRNLLQNSKTLKGTVIKEYLTDGTNRLIDENGNELYT